MGELARQRRARDLWISRGHLWALSAGVVLLALCSFFVGLTLARTSPAAASVPAPSGLDAPQESLVDLLARVDARVVAQDGVDTLTFPDTLTGVAKDPALPVPGGASGVAAQVAPGQPGARPMDLVLTADSAESAQVLAHALEGRGLAARVVLGQGDADAAQIVLPAGDDLEQARSARTELLEVLGELDQAVPVALRPRP